MKVTSTEVSLVPLSDNLILRFFATSGIFVRLYKAGWLILFTFGLLNILLIIASNYVHNKKGLTVYLLLI